MKTILFIFVLAFNLMAEERLVSLSPSITEIIYALDKGDELVDLIDNYLRIFEMS